MKLIKIIYLYLFGYINIYVEGFFIERFINICISKKIMLWRLSRENSTSLTARISIDEFKKIKDVAKRTKCKVKIKDKKGLPFLMKKYRKRKIFAITLLVIAILIFGLTRFIWNIDIICNGTINENEILDLLKSNGIYEGTYIKKINIDKIINNICLERDDISWVGIEVKGTNLIVNVVKSEIKIQEIATDEPCNIISDKDAVILKISSQNGTSRVSEGDVVKKGDILVEGIMEGKYTGNRYVHAEAEVWGKVWYVKEEEQSLKQEYFEETGKNEKKYQINIKDFKINFNKGLPKFENYDTIEAVRKVKLFSNYYIPIEIKTITYKEQKKKYKEYTIEELSNELQNKLKRELLTENKISEEKVIEYIPNITQTENSVKVKLTCVVKEKIGIYRQLIY